MSANDFARQTTSRDKQRLRETNPAIFGVFCIGPGCCRGISSLVPQRLGCFESYPSDLSALDDRAVDAMSARIYLDNNATTPIAPEVAAVAPEVAAAMQPYLAEAYGS